MTGNLESVGVSSAGVVHIVDSGPMGQQVMTVLDASGGLHPRLSISDSGDTSVIWLESSGAVVYRRHVLTTKTWESALTLSGTATAGTSAALAATDDGAWVSYEGEDEGERTVESTEIIDSAEPFGAASVADVDGTQDLDLRVFRESGEVWIVWDDSATELGWSALDPVSYVWDVPQYLAYNPGNKSASYLTIRNAVVGP